MVKNKLFLSLAIAMLLVAPAGSQDYDASETPAVITIQKEDLPSIPTLSSRNEIFKEYSSIIENNYKALTAGKKPENMFFTYINTEKFTLQGLASRCNIPYETIATLNGIESSTQDIFNQSLLLPTVPGLFIPTEKGISSIEVLLQENYSSYDLPSATLKYNINGRDFVFISNKRLSPTERAFFLDSAMQLPLDNDSYWVSSEFGKRKNPFSGQLKNHNGIDLAAAEGTPVYAIKDGAAYAVILDDPDFGNYIVLTHDQGKMTSVYAHLSKVTLEQYQSVKKGDLIGYVGQTGKVTGPHLHFEIRQGGKAEDPRLKLKIK